MGDVMSGGVRWLQSGEHFALGAADDGYELWAREDWQPGAIGEPVARYPLTPEGRSIAEAALAACEAARAGSRSQTDSPVRLRVDPADPSRAEVVLADVPIGQVAFTRDTLQLRTPTGPVRLRQRSAERLLTLICEEGAARRLSRVELTTADPLLRYAARRRGLAGPLRDPLCGHLTADVHTTSGGVDLGTQLESLLVAVRVVERPAGGSLRQLATRVSTGNATSRRLLLTTTDGHRLSMLVPMNDDILTENLARSADTAFGVMRRIGPYAYHVRELVFKQSSYGLRHAKHAAEAATSTADINMNPAYASASALDALYDASTRSPPRRRPMQVSYPFNAVDGVVAHEMWHHIEATFTGRRYTDSIQFRQRLGRYLGLPTIEHVSHPPTGTDPAVVKDATTRLREEVSEYATTSPAEATAEMFTAWWCATDRPAGVVRLFAELATEYVISP